MYVLLTVHQKGGRTDQLPLPISLATSHVSLTQLILSYILSGQSVQEFWSNLSVAQDSPHLDNFSEILCSSNGSSVQELQGNTKILNTISYTG